MKEERLMEHLRQATGSDGQECAAIVKLLYEYADEINCLGVVFKRLNKINEGFIKVQGSEEPLYVYEGEELPADFICPWCKHGSEDFEPLK